MSFSKVFNRKTQRWLGLSLLVAVLIFTFSHLENHLYLSASPTTTTSIYAQTTADTDSKQPEKSDSTQSPVKSEPEQQPKNSSEQSSSDDAKQKKDLKLFPMVVGLLGGLALFLYGVEQLAVGLKGLAEEKMKQLLSRFTTNRYAGVATGTVVTGLLDSSSVTIIMVIALVDAGLLTFAQSLGIVLGSNIGTTLGAQIYAFDVEQYGPILLFVGLLVNFIGKTDRWKQIGLVMLGVGLLFVGLDQIGEAMKPLEEYPPFLDLMQEIGENTLLGAAIGAGFTVLVQSSSATIAIVIAMASQGLISLPAGIAIMLGAELGTVADTLIATIRRSRPALRTGMFHLTFNLITCIVGIIFAAQLAALGKWLAFGADVPRQIANAQIIFNLLGVALFINFIPWFAQILEKLIPGGNSSDLASNQNLESAVVKK